MTAMTYQRTFPASAASPARPAMPVPTTTSPGRLTRRGRVVVVLVLATLALVVFSLGRASRSEAGRSTGEGSAAPRPTTVVQPGETLWSISRRIAPGADPRVMVGRLTSLNDLDGRAIQAGQRLTLPFPG